MAKRLAVYVVRDRMGKPCTGDLTKPAAKKERDRLAAKKNKPFFISRAESHPRGASQTNLKSSLMGLDGHKEPSNELPQVFE